MLYTPDVADIRQYFIDELADQRFVTDKTGCKMIELVGASFLADEKAIFGTVNEEYVEREVAWYESMSLNINDIPGGPPAAWKASADKDGFINSNYGYLMFHEKNGRQYYKVRDELLRVPDSRRAIAIYTRPNIWNEYNKNGMSDFICTNTVQYFIRNDRLDVVVNMRSNDVVFGYKNDFAWQSYVQLMLANDLNVPPGDIIWQVGSLHVYERHFHLVK